MASGYASTDALSNPVLPDESHSVYALSLTDWNLRELSAENVSSMVMYGMPGH